jgi:hypothetical protein
MRYLTTIPIRLRTPDGEVELKPGDTFKPKSEEAIMPFLAEGLIKPYCTWLEDVIEDCQPPCFHMSAKKVLRECSHFKDYWRRKLEEKVKDGKQN